MYATPIQSDTASFLEDHLSENSKPTSKKLIPTVAPLIMRPGTNRLSNFEIGRAAERKGVIVRDYDRGDRWLAWRKRTRKVKLAALARAAKANRKTKGKKVNKGTARPPRKK
jgi:large subunit ribosomal protein L27